MINILFIVLLLKKAGTKRKTSTSYPSRYSFMKVVCGEIVLATVLCAAAEKMHNDKNKKYNSDSVTMQMHHHLSPCLVQYQSLQL